MIKIYTDASFDADGYRDGSNNTLVGGIGIVAVFYNEYGDIINEEFHCKRYMKRDLKKFMYFNEVQCTNCLVEFIAIIEAFNILGIQGEEIELYSDWNIIHRLFNDIESCKSILRNNPNLKHLFRSFVASKYYLDNLIRFNFVKGHKGDYYNSVVDFLARYWLDPKLAISKSIGYHIPRDFFNMKQRVIMAIRKKRQIKNEALKNRG